MGVCSSSPVDALTPSAVERAPAKGHHKKQAAVGAPPPASAAHDAPFVAPTDPNECPHSANLLNQRLELTNISLGKGAFGEVKKAVWRKTGEAVGLKIISKITFRGEEERRLMLLEARLAHKASHPPHPHVVTTYEYAEDIGAFYMVLELATGGDLMERITKQSNSPFTEKVAARYFAQLAAGLSHIHEQGVVHRDLKPENFLMSSTSEDATVKITDFGLSAEIPSPDAVLTDACGSAYYIAPEVFNRKYTKAADVFSLGVNLFLFLSGTVPFGADADTEEGIYSAIKSKPLSFGPEWSQISSDAKELISGLLEKDPQKRYTLAQALAHRWLTEAPEKPLDKSLLTSLQSFNAKNKFKKNALRLVAAHMSAADVQHLRADFMKIDTDGSGSITHKEMQQAMKKMGVVDEATLASLIKNVDADGDGSIR